MHFFSGTPVWDLDEWLKYTHYNRKLVIKLLHRTSE